MIACLHACMLHSLSLKPVLLGSFTATQIMLIHHGVLLWIYDRNEIKRAGFFLWFSWKNNPVSFLNAPFFLIPLIWPLSVFEYFLYLQCRMARLVSRLPRAMAILISLKLSSKEAQMWTPKSSRYSHWNLLNIFISRVNRWFYIDVHSQCHSLHLFCAHRDFPSHWLLFLCAPLPLNFVYSITTQHFITHRRRDTLP
jgi:hypothetical protein